MTTTDTRQSLRDQYQALERILFKYTFFEDPVEGAGGITYLQGALTALVDVIDANLAVPSEVIQRWQDAAAEVIDMYPVDDDDDENEED
jgi:hypothetical protein